jgi:hypothetical protein
VEDGLVFTWLVLCLVRILFTKMAMYMYKVIFRVTYGYHDTQNEGYTQHRRACAATSCTLSFSS